MDKEQALQKFWSSFGIPAYDENTVPDKAEMPYITYNVSTDSFDHMVLMTASLWYHSTSWAAISRKSEEIANYIVRMHPPSIALDTGRLYITKGHPFAQRMNEPEDSSIRRILINIEAEYLTAT